MNKCYNTEFSSKAKPGDLALCAKGILGVITGKKGDAFVGFRVYDPRGNKWSSKKPRVIGRVGDLDGFVATLKGE